MAYNMVAVALPIIILQILILPGINARMTDDAYGRVVTMIAILNAVPAVAGNALCNTRQLLEGDYREEGLRGDFNILAVAMALMSSVIVVSLGGWIGAAFEEAALLLVVSMLMFAYNYGIVAFRIEISFRGMLLSSAILSIGMLLGYILFAVYQSWPMVLVVGYSLALTYLAWTTRVFSGGLTNTFRMARTLKIQTALLLSLLLSGLVTYGDRLVLFPILGPVAVSTYFIASLVGKMFVMAVSPMSTVILSYLSKSSELMLSKARVSVYMAVGVGSVFWVLTCLISPHVLGVLYPDEASSALIFVPLVTLVSVIQSLSSVLNPTLLRFFRARWQVVTNALALCVLVVVGLALTPMFDLLGFAVASLISSLVKFGSIVILVFSGEADAHYESL